LFTKFEFYISAVIISLIFDAGGHGY